MLKRVFTNWWVLAGVAALLTSLIVFLVCGLLVRSLLGWRWWLILAVWLIFGIAAGIRWFMRRRASAALAAAMAPPPDKESEAIGEKMQAALARVKSAGRDSLYALPWYVIIGPPGAGKTTLIQKSGLRLINDEAAQGVGGTRNCDWWFTDDAVLIDTAGRYTSQDSESERDQKGWQAFLGTLKRARPLQPLNGVIVAIGLDELAGVRADALDRHVVAIRARIAELSRILGLELPVYVMFTKADLINGFVEFFDDLTVEGRRSVIGYTRPVDAGPPDAAELAAGYDDAVQALADRIPARLQAESDPIRRGAALTLPARFIDLRARVVRLLEGVFDAKGAPVRLRGFYFTSGVQQGTPFDRLLGDLSGKLGRGLRPRTSNPRAFFVNRLLKDVVIAEAGLAGPDAKRRRRSKSLQLAAYAGLGVAGVLLLGAWVTSFFANSAGQRATAETAQTISTSARAFDAGDRVSTSATTGEVLDLLDSARDKLPYGVTTAAHPALSQRFGLYRGALADESDRAYKDSLQRYLLPRLIVTAERTLRAGGSDPVAVYEPLKVYLMLGNRAGAPRDADYIVRWLDTELAKGDLPGPENAAIRGRVIDHAKALFADSGRFGRDLTGPLLDASLVQTAQATVAAMSPAQRALALMKQQVTGQDWQMVGDALIPGEAEAFGNPQEVAAAHVPFLFTKKGFQQGFVKQASTIALALDKDRWMLGQSAASQAPLNTNELGMLYAAEYTKLWTDILALPRPGNYARDTMALARVANTSTSPLKKVAEQTVAQTVDLLPGIKNAPTLPGGMLGKLAGSALQGEMKASATSIAATTIQANFAGLRQYAGGGAEPLKQLLGALGKYQLALAQAAVASSGGGGGGGGGGASAAIAGAAAELQVAAANAGAAAPALASFVTDVASGSSKAAETTKTTELRTAYSQNVVPTCRTVFGKGYPFGGGADLQPADVSRAASTVSNFGHDQLGVYLSRDGKAWKWISEPTVKGFTSDAARTFQRADQVQAMMGGNLVLRIAAAPSTKGGISLRAAGVPMTLSPTTPAERFSWSTGGSQVAEFAATNGGVAPPLREEGPWALFRLLDKGRKSLLGPGRYRFTFSPDSAVDVEVASGPDPFAADGPFALRCPDRM